MLIQKYEKSESLTRRWSDFWLCSYLPQVSTTTILKARVRKSLTRSDNIRAGRHHHRLHFHEKKLESAVKRFGPLEGRNEAPRVHHDRVHDRRRPRQRGLRRQPQPAGR